MLTAIATDEAGNTAASPSRTITLDTTAPDAPAFVDVSGGTITVADRAAGVTLTGTQPADASTVTLCIGAAGGTCGTTPTATVAAAATTTWSYMLMEADYAFQGVLTFTATAADAAGNLSMATATTITVDTVAPASPAFVNVSLGTITADERTAGVTFTGTQADDVTAVTLCIGSVGGTCGTTPTAIVAAATTTWSYMLKDADYDSGSGQGKVTFIATATDLVGNPSNPSAIIITVDTIVPVFGNGKTPPTIIIPVDTARAYDAEATDNGGAAEVADAGISYTLSGDDAGLFTFTAETGIVTYHTAPTGAAEHNIIITATDAVGNMATQNVTISVLAAPTVEITDNIEADTPVTRTEDIAGIADGALTFTFTFSEPVNGFVLAEDIIVSGGGTLGTLTGTAGDQTYTLKVTPTTATNDGTLTVTVKANAVLGDTSGFMNPAGDTATQDYDIVAPTTAPTFASFASSTTYINAMHARERPAYFRHHRRRCHDGQSLPGRR